MLQKTKSGKKATALLMLSPACALFRGQENNNNNNNNNNRLIC